MNNYSYKLNPILSFQAANNIASAAAASQQNAAQVRSPLK